MDGWMGELDGKVDTDKSETRKIRIAKGSGTHPMEVGWVDG